MISNLENALLNLHQMLSQQAAHVALSLPLNCSSRKCIFIDTRPQNDQTFILKSVKELNKEDDESENVMCKSMMDYYLQHPQIISNICFAEFVSQHKKDDTKLDHKTKPKVICFINFNKHIDIESHCREQLILYRSFIISDDTLK